MSEQGSRRTRRLRALPAVCPEQVPAESTPSQQSVRPGLPGTPRVGALDALLRDVDDLRLTLETDLTLVASALEAGAPQVAVDILDSDREGLQSFEQRALGHLSELSAPARRARRRRHWVSVPAAPFVAAAAVVGFLVGVVPQTMNHRPDEVVTATVAATNSLSELTTAAASGQTNDVREAATSLHDELAAMVATAKSDPEAAQRALILLSQERAAIVQSGDSNELRDVLVQSTRLTNLILQALPPTARSAAPHPQQLKVAVDSSPTPRPRTTTTATTSTAPKAGSSPTPAATSSAQPSPSATKGDAGPDLPSSPALSP
jgi:hypothetical protein